MGSNKAVGKRLRHTVSGAYMVPGTDNRTCTSMFSHSDLAVEQCLELFPNKWLKCDSSFLSVLTGKRFRKGKPDQLADRRRRIETSKH